MSLILEFSELISQLKFNALHSARIQFQKFCYKSTSFIQLQVWLKIENQYEVII